MGSNVPMGNYMVATTMQRRCDSCTALLTDASTASDCPHDAAGAIGIATRSTLQHPATGNLEINRHWITFRLVPLLDEAPLRSCISHSPMLTMNMLPLDSCFGTA